jgi:hypothetical protein
MIAEGFPADDPVAQFVTPAAMISDGWQRLVTSMDNAEGSDQVGRELLGYRMQAALHYEAAQFLREALKVPGVEEFVAGLPRPARNDFDFVLAGLDSDPEVGHGTPQRLGDRPPIETGTPDTPPSHAPTLARRVLPRESTHAALPTRALPFVALRARGNRQRRPQMRASRFGCIKRV